MKNIFILFFGLFSFAAQSQVIIGGSAATGGTASDVKCDSTTLVIVANPVTLTDTLNIQSCWSGGVVIDKDTIVTRGGGDTKNYIKFDCYEDVAGIQYSVGRFVESGMVDSVAYRLTDNVTFGISSGIPTGWEKCEKIDTYDFLFTGQSNMKNSDANANDGGDRELNPNVLVWDDVQQENVVADLAEYPFGDLANAGHYTNKIAFHTAKRLQERLSREQGKEVIVRIIFEATGGQPISQWVGNGVNSPYYLNIMQKLTDAGVTDLQGMFWLQGEADAFNLNYAEELAEFISLLRAETMIPYDMRVVLGALAYGYDVNGNPIGTSGTGGVNPYTSGESLNRRFFRQIDNYEGFENVTTADGSSFATVSAGVAASIHFEGTGIVDYSDLFATTYFQSYNKKLDAEVVNEHSTKFFSSESLPQNAGNERYILDASAGNMSILLPDAGRTRRIRFERVDTTNFTVGILTSSANEFDNGLSLFEIEKQNDVVEFVTLNDSTYRAIEIEENHEGVSWYFASATPRSNVKKNIYLDNATNDVLINFSLPYAEYENEYYVYGRNIGSKVCRVRPTANSPIEGGVDVVINQGDVYRFYSDSLIYRYEQIIGATTATTNIPDALTGGKSITVTTTGDDEEVELSNMLSVGNVFENISFPDSDAFVRLRLTTGKTTLLPAHEASAFYFLQNSDPVNSVFVKDPTAATMRISGMLVDSLEIKAGEFALLHSTGTQYRGSVNSSDKTLGQVLTTGNDANELSITNLESLTLTDGNSDGTSWVIAENGTTGTLQFLVNQLRADPVNQPLTSTTADEMIVVKKDLESLPDTIPLIHQYHTRAFGSTVGESQSYIEITKGIATYTVSEANFYVFSPSNAATNYKIVHYSLAGAATGLEAAFTLPANTNSVAVTGLPALVEGTKWVLETVNINGATTPATGATLEVILTK